MAGKKGQSVSIKDAIAFLKDNNSNVQSIAEDAAGTFISTGVLALDYALSGKWIGGGIPRGKIVEIYGKSQGAKSVMLYSCLAGTQRIGGFAGVIDVEGGRSEQFMRLLSVNTEECQLIKPDKHCIQSAFNKISSTARDVRKSGFDGPITIGLDSIAALPTEADIKRVMGKKEENLAEDQGRRAKIIGHYERTMSGLFRELDVTLIIINQLRDKVGVMYGPKETTTSGRATEYFSDCRIDMRPRKMITKETFGAKSDDDEDSGKGAKIGRYFDFSCEKSRQTAPFRYVSEAELYFNQGLVPLAGVFGMLLSDEIIMHTGSGWYVVTEPTTRLTLRLAPVEGAKKFTRAQVEEGDWIFENAAVLGTTAEAIQQFIAPNIRAHEYARQLRRDARETKRKDTILPGNANAMAPDDAVDAPIAVKRAAKKSASVPLDETD